MSSDSSNSSHDDLPSTQPLEDISTSSQADATVRSPMTWSWLVNLRTSQVIPIFLDSVDVGRDPDDCQIEIAEELFTNSEDENLKLVRISRFHFEITKKKNRAILVDKSMNGTYVNKLLVGKGNLYSLNHADVISVLMDDFDLFLYLDERFMTATYPVTISGKYLVGRELGAGSTAVVKEGFTRDSLCRVALKIIGKRKWPSKYSNPQDLMKEVAILQNLQHPCITKVLEVVEDHNLFVIVIEYAAGGEMFDQVVADHDNKKMREETAKLQFYQISHTIAYLHSMNVCHRDLKLENILLMEHGSESLVKVTDFGLSKQFGSTKLMETYVGTPIYMAPEIISCCSLWNSSAVNTTYSCKSDCWSLGVILYMLLCGHPPFNETSTKSVFNGIISGKFDPMAGSCWASVSHQAMDLVTKLLNTDQESRLSAGDILDHQWFVQDGEAVSRAREVMGLQIPVYTEMDSGVKSCKQSGKKEDMEVDVDRTQRRKARERRKTQIEH